MPVPWLWGNLTENMFKGNRENYNAYVKTLQSWKRSSNVSVLADEYQALSL